MFLFHDGLEWSLVLSGSVQGKWTVPLPKVRAVGENEVFKVLKTGKRRRKCFNLTIPQPALESPSPYLPAGKAWKRMVTKVCFVGEGFTRKPPKYERFIRPMVSQGTGQ